MARRLVGTVFLGIFCLTFPLVSIADEQPLTVQGNLPMRDNLKTKVGSKVSLQLVGGQELSGKVVEVGENAVHLSELSGKEFYDAVIRLDQISALVVRVRDK
jgi:hypothetical protein